jgi:hypothetical protein
MALVSRARPFPDETAWDVLVGLAELGRSPGSHGEARAAELIAAELARRGARTRVEAVSVHGTYWIPLGLACGLATAASVAGRVGALAAAAACASIVDDLSIGRRPLRRALGRRVAHNVIGEYGPPDAVHTLVIHAHHDAAHTGLVFHPGAVKLAARLGGGLIERAGGTPAPMWGAALGPAAVALGGMLGARRLTRLGAVVSAAYAAAMADI